MVGPEGGWDPQEIADAAAAGVTLLSFGGANVAGRCRRRGGDLGAALYLADL